MTWRAALGVVALAILPTTGVASEPLVVIDARVNDDLTVVQGTLRVTGTTRVKVVDPLALLPMPQDDRTLIRTFPGIPEQGTVRFVELGDNTWAFTTLLPRRFGDVGTRPGRALFANGAWYPQPRTAEGLPNALWRVRVELPEGVTGAVGDVAGTDVVEWVGAGERASLAAVRRGRLTTLRHEGVELVLLTRGRPRRALRKYPARLLAGVRPPEENLRAVVVEAPMRRRLIRPGVRTAYVSDRAWRLTPGLRRYHHTAIARGLLQATLPIEEPVSREIAAAALARGRSADSAQGLLRWFSWNPVIDAILNDRRMPFWGDIFDAEHPEDPLADDLVEIHAPHGPGTALVGQLDDLYGPASTFALGSAVLRGSTLEEAATDAEVDPDLVTGWLEPYPEQDLHLRVDRREHTVTVFREAPPEATPEVVVTRVDGEERAHLAGHGPGVWSYDLDDGPRSVVLDPRGRVRQGSRRGDAWPARFTITGAAWIDSWTPTAGYVSGYASLWARGRDDTRNVFSGNVYVNEQDLPAVSVGWLHRRGPLQDGLSRPHRFTAWVSPAWSNGKADNTPDAIFTLGGGVGYRWDTRVSSVFPLRGAALSVRTSGGVAPTEETGWVAARVSTAGVTSWHPRWALAGRASAAIADGDTEQRLLWLGGAGVGTSLRPAAAIGTSRFIGQTELRWAPVRNASVSLLELAWLSEIQLAAGAEAGAMNTLAGERAAFAGVTGGVTFVADLLGANPALGGVTVGIPVWTEGLDAKAFETPQVTLRFGQAF